MPPLAVKEVRQPYPLPARPRSLSNVSSTNNNNAAQPRASMNPSGLPLGSPSLSVPRSSPFFTPQPSSPRPPFLAQAASPKLNFPPIANTPTAATQQEPDAAFKLKKAISPDDFRPNQELVNWGTGWTVHWRRWTGTALLELPKPTAAVASGTGAGPVRSRSDVPPPAKKPRAATAFEEMLAEEGGGSPIPTRQPASRVPLASTSKATPPLKIRLEALPSPLAAQDALERARSEVLTLAAGKPWLAMVPFVQFAVAEVPDHRADPKGKGKLKATEGTDDYVTAAASAVQRTFWVFSLVPAGPATEAGLGESTSPLDQLEFPDLVANGSGQFSHRTLIPGLYPSATEPTMVRPSMLKVSSFPSCMALSAELQPELTPTKSDLQAAHSAFISSLGATLISALVADPARDSTFTSAHPTRLGSSLVFVPPSLPSDSVRHRIPLSATSASFSFSLVSNGLLISPVVEDLPLRPFPTSTPPPALTPVVLAPFGTKASFIKAYPVGIGNGKIRDEWSKVLEGTGVGLQAVESWVLCRVTMPPRAPPPLSPQLKDRDGSGGEGDEPFASKVREAAVEEAIEVVWPRSLVLVDGTRPTPARSPEPTLTRPLPTNLLFNNVDADTPMTERRPSVSKDDQAELVTANSNLEPHTRRRLASLLKRQGAERRPYKDPVRAIADGVRKVMEDLSEAKERKEREDREERLREEDREREERERRESEDKLAASALTPVLPISLASMGMTSPHEPKFLPPAGAPINMRTPISLGGSSTEAPSPADGFGLPVMRGGPLASRMDVEAMYASPADSQSHVATSNGANSTGAQPAHSLPMAMMDQSFGEYDWDDFTSGPLSMPNAMRNDYDDGMGMGGMELAGLTDDDFSFFDDHPSASSIPVNPMASFAPPILPPPPSGLQSSGPSPKFVDHFSHLGTGSTPFASAGSPGSPFGHLGSPALHHHHSPLLSFPFDNNALGLAHTGTPGPSMVHSAPSPFKVKTPFTPYSPFVELGDLSEQEELSNSFSVSGTPAGITPHPFSTFAPQQSSKNGAFDPVNFGHAHDALDGKYDPRKGKFGLPSPASDIEDDQFSLIANTPFAGKPWFSVVCDPRVSTAGVLKRKQRAETSSSSTTNLAARSWIRSALDSDDESEEDEDLSEDDSFLQTPSDHTRLRRAAEHLLQTDYEAWLDRSFGPAIVSLGEHLSLMLEPPPVLKRPAIQPSKELAKKDQELDTAASAFVDQIVYNPDFRNAAADNYLPRNSVSKQVSAQAIQLVGERLARFSAAQSVSTTTPHLKTLVAQSPPALLLRTQQAIVQIRTHATRFWKSMGFEPLAGPKDVTAFAIFEDGGEDLAGAVKSWMGRVADTYQASRLGRQTPGVTSSIEDGLAIVPVGWFQESGNKDPFRTTLCSRISEAARFSRHVVVYVLTPPGSFSTSKDSPFSLLMQQLSKSKSASMSLVIYPIALSSIQSRSILLGDSTTTRLDRLAFSVYDQLMIPVSRLHFPVPETFVAAAFTHAGPGPSSRPFQFPAITVAPNRKPQIQFDVNWPSSSLEVMHRHRFLHIGYTTVPVKNESNLEWLVVSCIDEKGESWKMVPKLIRAPLGAAPEIFRAKLVWAITRAVAESADVEWRIVVCRLGVMTKTEMKAWHAVLKDLLVTTARPLHVTIMCSNLQPPLSVVPLPPTPSPTSITTPPPRVPDVEEGEVMRFGPSHPVGVPPALSLVTKPTHLDTQPSVYAFTPTEPIFISPGIVAPISTYLIHVPRIASYVHVSDLEPLDFPLSSSSISILGLHILSSHSSRTSTLSISLEQHVADLRQSYVEQSALAHARWGTAGRVPWHLDAVRSAAEILVDVR